MCENCGDVELIEWHQLALDDSHEIQYRALKCQCRWVLLTAVVKETSSANG